MPSAVQIRRTGGPEVLELTGVTIGDPGPGQLLVDVAAAGVNYLDTYQRSGLYSIELPAVLGLEGAGRVVSVGKGVTQFRPGDRVAWQNAFGSYATQALVPERVAVAVPDAVSDEIAAALLLQGITAHYLARSLYPVAEGDNVLVHAAAGGTGLLLTQLVKARGGRVLATVSSEEKAKLAREAGADEVIRYDEVDFAKQARELTGGEGVAVVYDGVGKNTFDGSLASLRVRGTLALFGAASGPVPPFDPQRLSAGGSLFLTRPTAYDYIRTREELTWRADELFQSVVDGKLTVRIGHRYPLAEARQAHEDLQARRTTGKLLLLP
ncbi:quinone oxidoreductase family protein [Amycolatopsis pithecellobii]|uniref:Zinc-binding dehydrogenase n=1 Tax=Amycolatopsis pithecellobii TaxID=664692 RepID=A0A6N7YVB8_9PSEU|nr:quinone oxidoreductase [Amycolatopsis pithecellobii]MTD55858.1 zinc-binding dehydrogenase [Amycolatopsis pithecellobii]